MTALPPFTDDPAGSAARTPRPSVVEVDHVTHVYAQGNVRALDDVSMVVEPGEIVGIMGQNGSGKTTLTKHLNGLLKPSAGTIRVAGVETTNKRVQELAAIVGYVFQNPNHQLFASTVADDLAFGPRNLGVEEGEIDRRVEQAIEFFGLAAVRALHPYRISFPMRKLVGIAAIYTMRPQIFVLDEPTTGQDHRTTTKINELIQRLRAEGSTVICVSHDMQLLADVVDRVVVMWDGHILADSDPRSVFADRAVMAQTKIEPPQITDISLRLAWRAGRPAALSVAELVAELGPMVRPASA